MHGPFTEFAALLLICALADAVFVRLGQPVLIACIFVGIGAELAIGFKVELAPVAHDQARFAQVLRRIEADA